MTNKVHEQDSNQDPQSQIFAQGVHDLDFTDFGSTDSQFLFNVSLFQTC